MKLLCLDVDSFSFSLDHPTPIAEKVGEKDASRCFDSGLVVFVSIEKDDDEKTVSTAAGELLKLSAKLKSPRILINPFAHLSSALAKPDKALRLSTALADKLNAARLPFGWYKSFSISVKGHENSQIFREF